MSTLVQLIVWHLLHVIQNMKNKKINWIQNTFLRKINIFKWRQIVKFFKIMWLCEYEKSHHILTW